MNPPKLSFTDTFLSLMSQADLIYNKEDGQLTILHADPLIEDLQHITFRHDGARVILNFASRNVDFGVDFKGEFEAPLKKNNRITLLHINAETKEAISGLIVELKQDTNS